MTEYIIGYAHRKSLLSVPGIQDAEKEAVERAYKGHGTEDDIRTCAFLYDSVCEFETAAELRSMIA